MIIHRAAFERLGLPQPIPLALPTCPTCGYVGSQHPRCTQCEFIAGPGHAQGLLIAGVCQDCRHYRELRKAARKLEW